MAPSQRDIFLQEMFTSNTISGHTSFVNLGHGIFGDISKNNYQGHTPTLLFDKARGQLMTTLNMHPINSVSIMMRDNQYPNNLANYNHDYNPNNYTQRYFVI